TRDVEEDRDTGIRSRGLDNSDRYRDRGRIPRDITVDVPATSRGTDTNIDVRSGDQITISATGTITAGRRVGDVGPDGARSTGVGINARPLPTAGVGGLNAFIRMEYGQLSQAYLLGRNMTPTVPTIGRLVPP